jgi:hypothetical protein
MVIAVLFNFNLCCLGSAAIDETAAGSLQHTTCVRRLSDGRTTQPQARSKPAFIRLSLPRSGAAALQNPAHVPSHRLGSVISLNDEASWGQARRQRPYQVVGIRDGSVVVKRRRAIISRAQHVTQLYSYSPTPHVTRDPSLRRRTIIAASRSVSRRRTEHRTATRRSSSPPATRFRQLPGFGPNPSSGEAPARPTFCSVGPRRAVPRPVSYLFLHSMVDILAPKG